MNVKRIFSRDIYTNVLVSLQDRTIEHVVPKMFLRHHKNDPSNLYMAHKQVNQFRRAYRFGGNAEMIYFEATDWEYRFSCFRNKKKNLFLPIVNHDLVIRIVQNMIRRHPYLSQYDIICEEDWSRSTPISYQILPLLIKKIESTR